MGLDDNKALVRQVFERVANLQELELADAIIADDYVDRLAPPDRAHGPHSLKEFVRLQRVAFPDAHITVEDVMAESDRVAIRINMTGTSARSGGPVRYRGTVWWRVADGKIVERWGAAFAREPRPGSTEGS